MTERGKMVCPDCGVEMNRHAEKVDYTTETTEAGAFDPDLGGRLEEFHTCPNCGRTHTRPAG
ncbi:MAG TPA: hypothetical protein VJ866_08285 [Pyrinomonadaceae bacterium]|nr:hypothetical protein [Pyrinomonadaceae bacterium]